MWSLTVLVILAYATRAFSAECYDGPLQEEIKFEKLAGTWKQTYYRGSVYGQAMCLESRIYGVNLATKEFNMESTAKEMIGSRAQPMQHKVLSTANWGENEFPGENNVKNHIASDYKNYIIFYGCHDGAITVSVELKRGVNKLHLPKIREVSSILSKVGVDFFTLEERAEPGCPEK